MRLPHRVGLERPSRLVGSLAALTAVLLAASVSIVAVATVNAPAPAEEQHRLSVAMVAFDGKVSQPAAAVRAARVEPTPLPTLTGGVRNPEAVKALALEAGWPEPLLDQVVTVAWCESRHNPASTNGHAWGLMQVTPLWFGQAGIDFKQWADPVANLRAAYAAYRYDIDRGYPAWTQWTCKPWGIGTAATDDQPASDSTPSPTPSPPATREATPAGTQPPAPSATTAESTRSPAASPTPAPTRTPAAPRSAEPPSPTSRPPTVDEG